MPGESDDPGGMPGDSGVPARPTALSPARALLQAMDQGGDKAAFAAWGTGALLTRAAAETTPEGFGVIVERFRNGPSPADDPSAGPSLDGGDEDILLADASRGGSGGIVSDAPQGLLTASGSRPAKDYNTPPTTYVEITRDDPPLPEPTPEEERRVREKLRKEREHEFKEERKRQQERQTNRQERLRLVGLSDAQGRRIEGEIATLLTAAALPDGKVDLVPLQTGLAGKSDHSRRQLLIMIENNELNQKAEAQALALLAMGVPEHMVRMALDSSVSEMDMRKALRKNLYFSPQQQEIMLTKAERTGKALAAPELEARWADWEKRWKGASVQQRADIMKEMTPVIAAAYGRPGVTLGFDKKNQGPSGMKVTVARLPSGRLAFKNEIYVNPETSYHVGQGMGKAFASVKLAKEIILQEIIHLDQFTLADDYARGKGTPDGKMFYLNLYGYIGDKMSLKTYLANPVETYAHTLVDMVSEHEATARNKP